MAGPRNNFWDRPSSLYKAPKLDVFNATLTACAAKAPAGGCFRRSSCVSESACFRVRTGNVECNFHPVADLIITLCYALSILISRRNQLSLLTFIWWCRTASQLQSLSLGSQLPQPPPPPGPPPAPPPPEGRTGFWSFLHSARPSMSAESTEPTAQQSTSVIANPLSPRPELSSSTVPVPPPAAETAAALEAACREAAIVDLSSRLRRSLTARRAELERKLGEATEAGGKLAARQQAARLRVAALQEERDSLDSLSQEMSVAGAALGRWLDDRAGRLGGATGSPSGGADSTIVPADELSSRALTVQAQDLALEDALYALDRLLNAGTIDPEAYVKQVRIECMSGYLVLSL